jgi:hypothetical protein
MRAINGALTSRLSALAAGGRSVPARYDPVRLIRKRLLHYGLAGTLAACLLSGSINKVWAQLCVCAEPGMMTCSLLGHTSHEPATSAFPQCQLHARGGGGGRSGGNSGGGRHEQFRKSPAAKTTHPQVEYGAGRLIRPPAIGSGGDSGGGVGGGNGGGSNSGGGAGGQPTVNTPPPAFDPQTGFQIKPLNCPSGLGLVKRSPTFYGGTRCGPPPPAAGGEPAPPQAGQADQPPKTDAEKQQYAKTRKAVERAVDDLLDRYGLSKENAPPVGAAKW